MSNIEQGMQKEEGAFWYADLFPLTSDLFIFLNPKPYP
jgi:hypothetical protein